MTPGLVGNTLSAGPAALPAAAAAAPATTPHAARSSQSSAGGAAVDDGHATAARPFAAWLHGVAAHRHGDARSDAAPSATQSSAAAAPSDAPARATGAVTGGAAGGVTISLPPPLAATVAAGSTALPGSPTIPDGGAAAALAATADNAGQAPATATAFAAVASFPAPNGSPLVPAASPAPEGDAPALAELEQNLRSSAAWLAGQQDASKRTSGAQSSAPAAQDDGTQAAATAGDVTVACDAFGQPLDTLQAAMLAATAGDGRDAKAAASDPSANAANVNTDASGATDEPAIDAETPAADAAAAAALLALPVVVQPAPRDAAADASAPTPLNAANGAAAARASSIAGFGSAAELAANAAGDRPRAARTTAGVGPFPSRLPSPSVGAAAASISPASPTSPTLPTPQLDADDVAAAAAAQPGVAVGALPAAVRTGDAPPLTSLAAPADATGDDAARSAATSREGATASVGIAASAPGMAAVPHNVGGSAAPAGSARGGFEATLSAQVGTPQFAPAVGIQISTLLRNGVSEARLHLNPAELGPIAVQIALQGTAAQVHLVADHVATRQALEQAMPQLAGSLQDAGFTLAGGGVSQQAFSSQGDAAGQASSGAAQRATPPGAAPDGDPAAPAAAAAAAADVRARTSNGLVDLFA